MKRVKKVIALVITMMMVLSLAGCRAQSKEEIMNEVVATVGEEEIKKEDLDKLVGFTLVSYYANQGVLVPSTDPSVSTLRDSVLNNMIEIELAKYVLEKYPVKVSKKEINKKTKSTIKTIQEAINDEETYFKVLETYGFGSNSAGGTGTSKNNKSLADNNIASGETKNNNEDNKESTEKIPAGAEKKEISAEEDFENTVKEYITLSYKLEAFENSFKDIEKGSDEYSNAAFVKVDGKEIPSYIFYYYMIQKEFEISYSGQPVSTNEEISKINKEVMDSAEVCQLYINKGKAAGIKVSNKELNAKVENMNMLESYYGADNIKLLCNAYGITSSQYEKAKKWVAIGDVYMEKVLKQNVAEVEVTESEAQKEFNNNKKDYETGTVSAKHILTEDRSLANEVLKKAQSTGDGFDMVMTEYQNHSGVKEVADIGEFARGQMVEEFADTAFDAEKGSIVGPVKTEYGYHVIYVYDVNKGEEPKFEYYKEQIIESLRSTKQIEAEDKYTQSIKKSSNIEQLRDMKNPFDMMIDSIKKEHIVKIDKKVVNK